MNATDTPLLPYDVCANVQPRSLTVGDIYPQTCTPVLVVIFGTVVPVLAVFVTLMNVVIISIFVKPHIRSHTSFILTLIAVADIFNIVCPAVVYFYFFTLGNFAAPIPFWFCRWTFYLGDIFSRFFNMLSLWFTVLLASVRYRCIKSPLKARNIHNWRNITVAVCMVVILALCVHVPTLVIWDFQPIAKPCTDGGGVCNECIVLPMKSMFQTSDTACTFRKIILWIEIILNSFLPCILLIFLDFTILAVLRKAEVSRSSLRRSGTQYGKSVKTKDGDQVATEPKENHPLVERNPDSAVPNIANNSRLNTDGITLQTGTAIGSKQSANTTAQHNLSIETSYPKKVRQLSFHEDSAYEPKDRNELPHEPTENIDETRTGKRMSKVAEIRRKAFCRSKNFNHSLQSCDSAFDRLNQECRRTSRLILFVMTIICTHEIPLGIIRCYAVATHEGTLPLNFFGCASVFLSLWQYVTYPLIFLVYCCMSAAFREEMSQTITCKHLWSRDEQTHAQGMHKKNVFMSPCSLRRTLSRGTDKCVTANQKISNRTLGRSNDIIEDDDEMSDFEAIGQD